MNDYTTSAKGIALIKEFEGCHLKAYPDPKTGGAPWTIGWGATGADIVPGLVWTQEQADARLIADVVLREIMVKKAVTIEITQGIFDAVVSIVFNVGAGSKTRDGIIRLKSGSPSTLLRKLNAGDFAGCAVEFLKWISPGSTVSKGLLRRRKAEVVLFKA